MPTISVIVPVYNAEKFLHQSISSLLQQTVQDFEIILVDDGSTDGSGNLCDQFERKHQNIRAVHRENGGLSAARNTGISCASNDFIMFIDADDYVDNDAVEKIENVVKLYNPDCICFGYRYIIGTQAQADVIPGLKRNTLLDRKYIRSTVLPPMLNLKKDEEHFIFPYAWNKVYKRSILQSHNIRFDETRRTWEDRSFVVEYLRYCDNFFCVDRAFYNYVYAQGSLSKKYFIDFFDIIVKNYHCYSTWYAGEYDFDNQYSNNYWCRAIEDMILRSLQQTKECDKIYENMLRVLSMPEVRHWYAKRIPQNKWERKATRLVAEAKYVESLELYRKKLAMRNKRGKRSERISYLIKVVKTGGLFMAILGRIKNVLLRFERIVYLDIKRTRLKNRTPCILASNCNGAFILHDMQCKFNTPTVNLYFMPEHFLLFLKNPQSYLNAVPIEVKVPGITHPVGRINDVLLFFMHYDSFEEARDKWVQRSKRVDMSNVFIMMTDRNGCTYENLKEFEALPYKNKVVFTHKEYPEFPDAYYIPGFESDGEVGVLSDRRPGFWNRRWLDDFDYVSFLNNQGD